MTDQPSKTPLEDAVECMKEATSLNVLVTGKTGTGKSTLISKLLGVEVESLEQLTADTKQIGKHTKEACGVSVCVWDTPGFQDGTANQDEYVQQIHTQCRERDLTLYCIKCGGENRFVNGDENPDVAAMKKLTQTFGVRFWSNTVIVLTHANAIGKMDDDWEEYSDEKKSEIYKAEIKKWRDRIRDILCQLDVKDKVQIVPAGQKKPHLPDTEFWLTALLRECVDACLENRKKAALLKLNEGKITEETYSVLICGTLGGPTLVGLGIGAATLGGLGGMIVGAAGGYVVGLALLALAHFIAKNCSKKNATPQDKNPIDSEKNVTTEDKKNK